MKPEMAAGQLKIADRVVMVASENGTASQLLHIAITQRQS